MLRPRIESNGRITILKKADIVQSPDDIKIANKQMIESILWGTADTIVTICEYRDLLTRVGDCKKPFSYECEYSEIFPPPPTIAASEGDEYESDDLFKFQPRQVAMFLEKFMLLERLSMVNISSFIFLAEDLICLSKKTYEDERTSFVPEPWLKLTRLQLEKLADLIAVQRGFINWKNFIIASIDLPLPTQAEILDMLGQFRSLDPEIVNCLDKNKFDLVNLWFERTSQRQFFVGLTHLQLRECIFQLFCDQYNNFLYIEFLLYFCKDKDPRIGFANSLALMIGQVIPVDDLPVAEVDYNLTDAEMEMLFSDADLLITYDEKDGEAADFVPMGQRNKINITRRMTLLAERRNKYLQSLIPELEFMGEFEGEGQEQRNTPDSHAKFKLSLMNIKEPVSRASVKSTGGESDTESISSKKSSRKMKGKKGKPRKSVESERSEGSTGKVKNAKWRRIINEKSDKILKEKSGKSGKEKKSKKKEKHSESSGSLRRISSKDEMEEGRKKSSRKARKSRSKIRKGKRTKSGKLHHHDSESSAVEIGGELEYGGEEYEGLGLKVNMAEILEDVETAGENVPPILIPLEAFLQSLWFGHITAYPIRNQSFQSAGFEKLKELVESVFEENYVSGSPDLVDPYSAIFSTIVQHPFIRELLKRYKSFQILDLTAKVREVLAIPSQQEPEPLADVLSLAESVASTEFPPIPSSPPVAPSSYNSSFSNIFSCLSMRSGRSAKSDASVRSGGFEARRLSRGSALEELAIGLPEKGQVKNVQEQEPVPIPPKESDINTAIGQEHEEEEELIEIMKTPLLFPQSKSVEDLEGNTDNFINYPNEDEGEEPRPEIPNPPEVSEESLDINELVFGTNRSKILKRTKSTKKFSPLAFGLDSKLGSLLW